MESHIFVFNSNHLKMRQFESRHFEKPNFMYMHLILTQIMLVANIGIIEDKEGCSFDYNTMFFYTYKICSNIGTDI